MNNHSRSALVQINSTQFNSIQFKSFNSFNSFNSIQFKSFNSFNSFNSIQIIQLIQFNSNHSIHSTHSIQFKSFNSFNSIQIIQIIQLIQFNSNHSIHSTHSIQFKSFNSFQIIQLNSPNCSIHSIHFEVIVWWHKFNQLINFLSDNSFKSVQFLKYFSVQNELILSWFQLLISNDVVSVYVKFEENNFYLTKHKKRIHIHIFKANSARDRVLRSRTL